MRIPNPDLFFSSSFPKAGQTPVLLKKYERKTANHLFWAPTGQFVVLAGLRSMNGCLEFVDTGDFTTMGTGEHFMCTDVEWDPTGRSAALGSGAFLTPGSRSGKNDPVHISKLRNHFFGLKYLNFLMGIGDPGWK
jgi:hypothetical protein